MILDRLIDWCVPRSALHWCKYGPACKGPLDHILRDRLAYLARLPEFADFDVVLGDGPPRFRGIGAMHDPVPVADLVDEPKRSARAIRRELAQSFDLRDNDLIEAEFDERRTGTGWWLANESGGDASGE